MSIKEDQQKHFQRAFEGWKHLQMIDVFIDALWMIGLFAAGFISEWGWQFWVLLILWVLGGSVMTSKLNKLEQIWLGCKL